MQAHTYHKGDVNALATDPSHKRMFSAGSDGQVIVVSIICFLVDILDVMKFYPVVISKNSFFSGQQILFQGLFDQSIDHCTLLNHYESLCQSLPFALS